MNTLEELEISITLDDLLKHDNIKQVIARLRKRFIESSINLLWKKHAKECILGEKARFTNVDVQFEGNPVEGEKEILNEIGEPRTGNKGLVVNYEFNNKAGNVNYGFSNDNLAVNYGVTKTSSNINNVNVSYMNESVKGNVNATCCCNAVVNLKTQDARELNNEMSNSGNLNTQAINVSYNVGNIPSNNSYGSFNNNEGYTGSGFLSRGYTEE